MWPTTSPTTAPASLATYTGNAKLFQVDTTIKGDSMIIDEKQGDLSASGHTMTSTLREQEDKDKKKVRSQSTGTSNDLKYEDGPRRLTYTGAAHLVGPEGDMSAQKIELYLKLGGDDVERAEGYAAPNEKLTLREVHRTTTGARMTYTADKETYVVTGAPATRHRRVWPRDDWQDVDLREVRRYHRRRRQPADPHADQRRQRQMSVAVL